MNIREVAISTKMSEQAVRTAIRKGKLVATKVPLNETQFRHDISEEAVTAWRNGSGQHNSRADGRRKMLLYGTNDELAKIVTLLNKNGLAECAKLIREANPKLVRPAKQA